MFLSSVCTFVANKRKNMTSHQNPFDIIGKRFDRIEESLNILLGKRSEAEIINLDQASELTHLSKSTLYKKTSKGTIPHIKQGKKLLFVKQDLIDFLIHDP